MDDWRELLSEIVGLRRRLRSSPPKDQPPAQSDPLAARRVEALKTEYELLREDDRAFPAVMVAMGSAAAIVGGTSIFFLLRGCGVETTSSCTLYPGQIYALLPAPSLAVTALLVQQAVVATIRGRLMLAMEAALSLELDESYLLGSVEVPIYSTYHFQQQMNHEARGAALWSIMFSLPLVLLVGLIYYSGLKLYGLDRWIFYCGYAFLIGVIAWSGMPVLLGYHGLDTRLNRYLQKQRAKGIFKI
jgi:hypothetical protein